LAIMQPGHRTVRHGLQRNDLGLEAV
jgi:hypothetical protein